MQCSTKIHLGRNHVRYCMRYCFRHRSTCLKARAIACVTFVKHMRHTNALNASKSARVWTEQMRYILQFVWYHITYFFPSPSYFFLPPYFCIYFGLVALSVSGCSASFWLIAVTFLSPRSTQFPVTPDFSILGLQA